ncbi:synaptophysin isoform X2 [Procambarus clarkii]|uniref:synaptophysin isoform X2 n=1 Tax=Procambarus clarkii TaxID=6728 RepID=UPI001E6756DE|nr:synaptophysin-like isoform X2 [Procambarus clarkii]
MEAQPQEEAQPMPMQYDQQPPPVYMEQPKTPLQGILTTINTRILKEPRGFMKVLQFIFGICAFATTTSFSTSFSFGVKCPGEIYNITENIAYPFQLDSVKPLVKICEGNEEQLQISGDFSSDAQFFVAVGVLAFLYTIGALALYCAFTSIYENNEFVPVADCGAHVLFAILWLAASSAWANNLSNLKYATHLENIFDENPEICKVYGCLSRKEASFSKLVISVILGFLNVFLWASNIWFLYKETRYFKDKANAAAAENKGIA